MLERHKPQPLRIADGEITQDPLDQQQYEAFKAVLPTWRDVLIAKMLRSTGVRVMEGLRLEGRQYYLRSPDFSILVKRSKRLSRHTGEYERVYLPPGLGVELRDYIFGNRIAPQDRVFPISDWKVRHVFAAAGNRGIRRPVHRHHGQVAVVLRTDGGTAASDSGEDALLTLVPKSAILGSTHLCLGRSSQAHPHPTITRLPTSSW